MPSESRDWKGNEMPTASETIAGAGGAVLLWRIARWLVPLLIDRVVTRWAALEAGQAESLRILGEIKAELGAHLAADAVRHEAINRRLELLERATGPAE